MKIELIRLHLEHLIQANRVPHSLLFSGSKKDTFAIAQEFAGKLLCANQPHCLAKIVSGNHPDLHMYYPEGKSNLHTIQSLKELCKEVAMRPNESLKKIFIVTDAEKMQPAAANALLKTFEEPILGTIIILLSEDFEKILPTILSRCHTVRFNMAHDIKLLNAFQQTVLDIFVNKNLSDFFIMQNTAKELNALVEQEMSEYENSIPHESIQDKDSLLASQYHALTRSLFGALLHFFREQEILNIKASSNQFSSLEKAYSLVKQSSLAIERSIKLSTCLEGLFLNFFLK